MYEALQCMEYKGIFEREEKTLDKRPFKYAPLCVFFDPLLALDLNAAVDALE